LEGERSFNAMTGCLETIAKAVMPFAFFPMPRSLTLRFFGEVSDEEGWLEERAQEPSTLEVLRGMQ